MTRTGLRDMVAFRLEGLHDEVTDFFTKLDGGGSFREDCWERPGGGGGVSRVLSEGTAFEKAGVNRSLVEGVLDPQLGQKIGARSTAVEPLTFLATGMSVVAHPRSPMVPTIHLNLRYFEIVRSNSVPVDAWFGGGTDLTPTYPFPEDAADFHRALRTICDRHHETFYPRFKSWCDHYFVNTHRSEERRGVGGIFFDHLRSGEGGLDLHQLFDFVTSVAGVLTEVYAPIVERRSEMPYGERERRFQLVRRGRYAEFNLLHDRGTLFGLQTGARIESVLMSLPPMAAWDYSPVYEPGSFEAKLLDMLEPRDWAG